MTSTLAEESSTDSTSDYMTSASAERKRAVTGVAYRRPSGKNVWVFTEDNSIISDDVQPVMVSRPDFMPMGQSSSPSTSDDMTGNLARAEVVHHDSDSTSCQSSISITSDDMTSTLARSEVLRHGSVSMLRLSLLLSWVVYLSVCIIVAFSRIRWTPRSSPSKSRLGASPQFEALHAAFTQSSGSAFVLVYHHPEAARNPRCEAFLLKIDARTGLVHEAVNIK
jgi:hypothetical protein